MQFEKIRRINKNKVIIGGLIGLGVIGAITILPSHAKYKLTESINIVNGTVNYKVPDLKVMAMYQENDSGNYDEITTMPESGYVINEEKTYCTTDNVNQVKGKAYTNSSGELVFKNLTKSDKCYLYFDKYTPPITMLDIIAANNPKDEAPDFSQVATTDEGLFKVADGMYGGDSYYWRGAVTNNYVKFANFCWRIVRINGDGTMRLIYDGATCHANGESGQSGTDSIGVASVKYNSNSNQSNYVGWTYTGTNQKTLIGTASNAKTQLEIWYKTNITDKGYGGQLVQGKYCNDREAQSGSTWVINGSAFYYAAYKRIYTDYTPTLSCPSDDTYQLNVGLITADEVMYAGGLRENNTSYYLYNGQTYWTMSPYQWDGLLSSARVFIVNNNGQLWNNGVFISYGLRPVINLSFSAEFKAGSDGTLNNPYEVL